MTVACASEAFHNVARPLAGGDRYRIARPLRKSTCQWRPAACAGGRLNGQNSAFAADAFSRRQDGLLLAELVSPTPGPETSSPPRSAGSYRPFSKESGGKAINMHESFVFSEEKVCRAPTSRTTWLASARARFVALLKSCADYCAAAAAYDDLSRLSDGELKHRGLSRDVLVRDLSAWRDRGSGN